MWAVFKFCHFLTCVHNMWFFSRHDSQFITVVFGISIPMAECMAHLACTLLLMRINSICITTLLSLSRNHAKGHLCIPQCNFSLEFLEILSQNLICSHWLSVFEISKGLRCEILMNIPCYIWAGKWAKWSTTTEYHNRTKDCICAFIFSYTFNKSMRPKDYWIMNNVFVYACTILRYR